jgi:glycosyltransferase involved in cell wall biosynthesis
MSTTLQRSEINERPLSAAAYSASVIVLSYNSRKTIRRCLDSLLAQETSVSFEIIVVDSGRDDTASIVEHEYPTVRLIHLSRRAFPGEARNVGVVNSSADIVAFLASDCVAHPQWLNTRFQWHEQGFMAVGGAITNANPDSIIGWANYFMEYLYCLPSRPMEEIKGKLIHNLSYKRELFQRHGLFPPHLRMGEDTVFNRRMMLNQERVLFEPKVRTGHINPTSVLDFLEHQYEHGVSFALACRKGELSFFRIPDRPIAKFLSLYQPLVRYPLLRIRNSVQVVRKHQPALLSSLIWCFPFLVSGIFSAAFGIVRGFYTEG